MAKGQKIIDDSLKIKDNDFPGADELLPVLVPLIGYSALLLHYNELPLINRTPIFDRYRIEKDYIIDLLNGLNLLEKSGVEYILGKQYKSNSYHAQQLEMVLESLPTEAYLFNLEHPIAHIFQDKNKPIDEQYQQIKQIAIDAGLFGGDFRLLPDEKQIKADFRLIVMPILANLALKLKFGAIPKALNVNDLNHALSNKQSIVDILEKHDILIAENGCYLLNHFYDSSFENKGSYAYNVRWLWTEINIEIEYQSKLAKAHGLKRLLIEKPEHRL